MSDDCKTLLDRLGKYFFKDRGEIEVKVCHAVVLHIDDTDNFPP